MSTVDMSQSTPEKQKRESTLVRSTLMLMVLFGIAKAISLGQTVIIANAIGLGAEWDAFVTANRIPELLVILISGGALGHAFIPIFSSYLARGEKVDGYRLASHVVNTVFTVAIVLSTVIFILTPWIVPTFLLDSNVVAPDTIEQAAAMMRLLLAGTVIFAISGIFSSILHSHNNFLLPALAPIMYDLGILFGVVFLLPRYGIYGVAVGTVIGAAAHLLIQVPGLIKNGARWTPEIGFRDPQLWRVIRLMLPRIAGLFVFQFNFIVMTRIASSLGTGAISALDWGWRIMQIPQTLIGTAMGIVIFPTLAALSEIEDISGKRNAMSGALKFIMVASIPSAIGLILIGQPMLSLLERGAFNPEDTQIVYTTLSAFTLGLIVHSMLEVVARSFYADKDTLTPLWAALGGASINLVLSLWLSGILFNETPPIENVMWLAFANSMGVAFEVGVLVILLRNRWQGINENSVIVTTLKTLVASLVMGAGVIAVGQIFAALGLQGRLLLTIIQLIAQVIAGGVVFFVTAILLGMTEVTDIIRILLRRNKPDLESIQSA